jgi:hypothetical protein
MSQLLNDSLLIFGFLAIVLAPLTLVIDMGPDGAGWKLLLSLLCPRCVALFFRLKSAHRACGVGSSVDMRDSHGNKPLSTRCVIRDGGVFFAANIAKLPELLCH